MDNLGIPPQQGQGRWDPFGQRYAGMEFRSQAARGEVSARRYTGRSSASEPSHAVPGRRATELGAPLAPRSRTGAAAALPSATTRTVPWSLRRFVAVTLMAAL